MVLGIANYCYVWDWDTAQAEFEKAIRLNSNHAQVHLFYGDFLLSMKRSHEAFAEMERGLALDPLNAFSHTMLGWSLLATREYDEAIVQLQVALKTEPNLSLALRCLWTALHHEGRYAEALELAQRFYRAQALPEAAEDLAQGHAEGGYTEALRFTADRLARRAQHTYVPAMHVARLYAYAGDKEAALDWLEMSYGERFPSMFSINVDPHWDVLREHPRFRALLDKMQLER